MTELRNARHLSVHDLRRRINEGDVDTVVVAFTDMQGRLQGARVHATYFAEDVLDQGLPVPGHLLASDEEITLALDLQTTRLLPHQPGAVLVLCDAVRQDRTPIVQSPRTILTQQVAVAASRGYDVVASTELEFLIFQQSYDDARTAGYRDLAAASADQPDYSIMAGSRTEPLLRTIRNAAYAAGIDLGTIKAGRNRGQHGISFVSQDAITTADNQAVFKTIAKEIAAQHGNSMTFMAAYDEQQRNACQVRMSLRAAQDSAAFGSDGRPTRLSDSFVAGLLGTLEEFTLLYASNVNSYKRLGAGPSETAIRLVADGSTGQLENRLPGADVNLYLALAAMIAGGLHGIDHDLELGPTPQGDVASGHTPRIPGTLREARQAFGSSQIARTAFGDQVVDHYLAMADAELAAFEAAVTNWELRRGFERM
jgi:glutamine synthetase